MSALRFEGTTIIEGDMGGALLDDSLDGSEVSGQFESMNLTGYYLEYVSIAEAIAQETDSGEFQATVPGGGLRLSPRESNPSLLISKQATEPLQFTVEAEAGSIAAAGQDLRFGSYIGGYEPAFMVPSKGHLQASLVGAAGTIQGSPSLTLWHVDVDHASGSHWSGQQQTSMAGAPGNLDAVVHQTRAQVIHAHASGAVLDLPAGVNEQEIYASTMTLKGSGTLVAASPIDANGDPLGLHVQLEGDFEIRVNWAAGQNMQLAVVSADAAMVDGEDVNPTSLTSAADPSTLNQWMWFAPLFLVAIPLAARQSPSVRLRALKRQLDAKDYAWVVSHARPAMRSRRTAGKASLFRTTSLLALGRFQEARLFLAALPHDRRPDPATFHFLSAHAAASLGHETEASSELANCFAMAPEYREEAYQIPVLQKILGAMPHDSEPAGQSYS